MPIQHEEKSELADKIVKIKPNATHFQVEDFGGSNFVIEDWNDRVFGKSWMDMDGNPACMVYAMRAAQNHLPTDNEVFYGKIDHLGHLVHITELEINS